jgi:cbb3-type cytochrome oxidase subunit 3
MDDKVTILLWLQQHSVVLVVAVFTLMLISLFLPGMRARYDRDARIPFDDER